MPESHPIIPGAQAWSSPGTGERARIGVVLLHGFTGNPVSMRPLGEALAERGFAVDLPRLPGHGTHWRDMMRTRYADWRAEGVRAVDRLKTTTRCVVLGGLSMGGTLALDIASERQDDLCGAFSINALVLDRQGLLDKLAPVFEKIFPVVPPSVAKLAKNDIAQGGDEKAYAMVPAASGNSLMRELPRIREMLHGLKLPLLVAHSRQDHSVNPENSKAILRMVGSRDVTELVLERSYHVATLDWDLPVLIDAITAFCDRVAADKQTAATRDWGLQSGAGSPKDV